MYRGYLIDYRKENDDLYILKNIKSGVYYYSNYVATRVYELLDKRVSVKEIVETLAKEYNAPIYFMEKMVLMAISQIQSKEDAVHWKQESKFPLRVSWRLTDRCNLKCLHCYATCESEAKQKELPLETIKSIVDKLEEANIFEISLTGGEIFVRHDLKEIIEYINSKNITLALFTNATLVLSNYEWLKECHIRRFNISLDGLEEEHDLLRGKGNFKRTVDAIKLLQKDGARIVINCVINSLNVHRLVEILHFFVENKLEFQFSLMTPIGRGADNIDIVPKKEVYMEAVKKLQEEYEKLKIAGFIHNAYTGEDLQIDEDGETTVSEDKWVCNAGTTKFDIDVNGDVYCCPFSKSSFVGNIVDKTVKELWENESIFNFINFTKTYNGRFCKPIGDTMNEQNK